MAGYCSTARAVRAGRRSPAVLRASRVVAPRRFVRRRPSDTGHPTRAVRHRPSVTGRAKPTGGNRPPTANRGPAVDSQPNIDAPSRIGRRASAVAQPAVRAGCRPRPTAGGRRRAFHRLATEDRQTTARIDRPRSRSAATAVPTGHRNPSPATDSRHRSPGLRRRTALVGGGACAGGRLGIQPPPAFAPKPHASRLAPTPTEADFRAAHAHRTHGCAGRARTAPRPRARSRRQTRTRTRTSRCARR